MAKVQVSDVWPEWKVEELLGEGTYGKVYRVSNDDRGDVSYAAVKVIAKPGRDAGRI